MVRVLFTAGALSVLLLTSTARAQTAEPATPLPTTPATGPDVVVTKDGVSHRGRILSEVQGGFLFRGDDGVTRVIPFDQIDDLQRGSPATFAPPATTETTVSEEREDLTARVRGSPEYRRKSRSVGMAYALELLFPGAGLIYAGAMTEGIMHLLLVTVVPAGIVGVIGGLAAGVYFLVPPPGRDEILRVGGGLVLNLAIILAAALLSARVTSVIRAGPAVRDHNEKPLAELVRAERRKLVPEQPENADSDNDAQ
ncbi:MAG: hypothetical protein AB2A00_14875 [Myxococcota bacterium]